MLGQELDRAQVVNRINDGELEEVVAEVRRRSVGGGHHGRHGAPAGPAAAAAGNGASSGPAHMRLMSRAQAND